MKVSEAIASRKTVRAFKPDPVSRETVETILALVSRAPSGGNLQPWKVYALLGEARAELIRRVAERRKVKALGEAPEYHIYPPALSEPYKTRRFAIGEAMYGALGIPREDKAARLAFFSRNWEFFGAPVGLIILHRPPDAAGPMGRCRHVPAIDHAARARTRPAHLSAGSLGGMASHHPRVSFRARERDGLLRHGTGLCG